MDSYWNGRRIVYAVAPGVVSQLVPDVKVKVTRQHQPKEVAPVIACNPRYVHGVHIIALEYAENVNRSKALKRAMGWFTARPKPGKDGSIRKASEKMAIAAWRQARVMGKPGRGDRYQQTASMDALDLDYAMRREMRRQMLARVRIA